ncbi:unnamed protein product [Ceratitis capitata]|uniref:(Mediterranean fruit fly) hypothetical protein n=1 Tax=Ceratitis capitata TaxID=7213 RepID=A0A811USZ7_CERCA|nr:unnamed protein product [Ceratitis capitata]
MAFFYEGSARGIRHWQANKWMDVLGYPQEADFKTGFQSNEMAAANEWPRVCIQRLTEEIIKTKYEVRSEEDAGSSGSDDEECLVRASTPIPISSESEEEHLAKCVAEGISNIKAHRYTLAHIP